MLRKSMLHWLLFAVPIVIGTFPYQAAAGKKIYVSTDMEGASGVFQWAQVNFTTTTLSQKAREYFMSDLNAVIRGLRDGGATEIIVLDGHGNGAVVPHLMEPGAKYVVGHGRSELFYGLDKDCIGMVMVGYHSMMGTPDGVLNHTQNGLTENRYWYNGVESGEMVQEAIVAGHYGVPPIMVTGDEATCREALKFFGKTCVTVAVKKGLARESAVLYPLEETRQKLYEGARRAMAAIPQCKPYKIDLPIRVKIQYLAFDGSAKPKLITREATVPDALHIFNFR